MYKNAFALALVAAVVSAQGKSGESNGKKHNDPDFKTWTAKNNKNFTTTAQMKKREANFNASKTKVENLRTKYPKTEFALNVFADYDEDEMKAMMGLDVSQIGKRNLEASPIGTGRKLQGTAPNVNWRDTDFMTPIKNQGSCGSCWTFNATTVLEAKKSIKDSAANGGTLVAPQRLSEQQGVDCSGEAYFNNGCNGGWPSRYWRYVRDAGGAVHYSDYTYTGVDGTCRQDGSIPVETQVQSWNQVSRNDQAIANALQSGPLSVALMVEGDSFYYYSGGLMPTDECVTNSVNHAVVLTGYNNGQGETIPGEPVWVEGTPAVWVEPVQELVPGTPAVWVEPVTEWVEGTPSVWVEPVTEWVEGTPSVWVEAEQVWVEGTPAVWVDPVLEWVEGTAPQEIPGEPVWVEGTDPVWVEGTADIWVPGTEGSCRKASRREKRAWQCNDGLILSSDRKKCCTEGTEGYWISGEPGYFTEGTDGYYIDGEPTWTEGTAGQFVEVEAGYWTEATEGYYEEVAGYWTEATEGQFVEVEAGYWTEAIEGQFVEIEAGYWTEPTPDTYVIVEPGYWTEPTAGYWEPGEDIIVNQSEPYWIIQNSWGTGWGDNGMIKIPVQVGDQNGHCNIQNYVENVEVV